MQLPKSVFVCIGIPFDSYNFHYLCFISQINLSACLNMYRLLTLTTNFRVSTGSPMFACVLVCMSSVLLCRISMACLHISFTIFRFDEVEGYVCEHIGRHSLFIL